MIRFLTFTSLVIWTNCVSSNDLKNTENTDQSSRLSRNSDWNPFNNVPEPKQPRGYQTCYLCHAQCGFVAMEACRNQQAKHPFSEIDEICKVQLACCFGEDSGIDLETTLKEQKCLGKCETKFVENEKEGSLAIYRGCRNGATQKSGIFYANDRFDCEDCTTMCRCGKDKCNNVQSVGDCRAEWSRTATVLWYIMLAVLAFILFGEMMWFCGVVFKLKFAGKGEKVKGEMANRVRNALPDQTLSQSFGRATNSISHRLSREMKKSHHNKHENDAQNRRNVVDNREMMSEKIPFAGNPMHSRSSNSLQKSK